MKQIKFPTTQDEMRKAIKIAIETYSQTPVKNENKLNESLAKSLGADEYNDIAHLAKDSETRVLPYAVDFDYEEQQQLIINGQRIDVDLTHVEIVNFTVIERDDRISDIERMIGEAQHRHGRTSDLPLMREDLHYLIRSSAEFVLESMHTNDFIAPDLDPERFNETCDEMIAAARAHYKKEIGELSKTGAILNNASTYYSGEPVEGLFEGELVLLKENRLNDDELPLTMPVYKFRRDVPDGYIAAYQGSFNEYVPVNIDDD